MAEPSDESISPTVKKVLDQYGVVLKEEGIDNDAVDRLDALLRSGKTPKFEDIDAALFPSLYGDNS